MKYPYAELLTRSQLGAIFDRMLIYWPSWELDEEDGDFWFQSLKEFPGVIVWKAVSQHRSGAWPPRLGEVIETAEKLYEPLVKLEIRLGLRDTEGHRGDREFIDRHLDELGRP